MTGGKKAIAEGNSEIAGLAGFPRSLKSFSHRGYRCRVIAMLLQMKCFLDSGSPSEVRRATNGISWNKHERGRYGSRTGRKNAARSRGYDLSALNSTIGHLKRHSIGQ